MRAIRLLGVSLVAILIGACGGSGSGGDEGGGSTSVTPPTSPTSPVPAVVGTVTFTMGGESILASPEANIGYLTKFTCQSIGGGSGTCAKVVHIKLAAQVAGMPLENITFSYNGAKLDDGHLSVTTAGAIQLNADVPKGAKAGDTALITIVATVVGEGRVTVVGTPVKVYLQPEVVLKNATPYSFSRTNYGEIGGFDLTCPTGVPGNVCFIRMEQVLQTPALIPVNTRIDTFIGTTWWYQLPTTAAILGGMETFVLSSPLKVAAGTTHRVSIRGVGTGKLTVRIEVTDGTNTLLPISPASLLAACQTVVNVANCSST